jgi:tetratricopeptide (TPR) repeat protein
MVKIKAVGLLAAVVAACPAFAVAQNAGEAEQAASRLREADRLEQQGMAAVAAGHYASATIPLEAALMIRERAQGPDHADTLRVLNNLGLVSLTLGQTKEAEALLTQSLASVERLKGADHPEVADILQNLAAVLAASDDARRVERSLPLLERAAAVRARALGPEHPGVASPLHTMAMVDLSLARRAGAWRMPDLRAVVRPSPASSSRPSLSREAYLDRAGRGFERSLAIREKALGPDHRDVAASLRGLASVQVERGDYARAEPLMRRSLAISEKALPPDHPALAVVLDDYASILGNARKGGADAEVKALKTRARAIRDAQVRRASAEGPPSIAPAR